MTDQHPIDPRDAAAVAADRGPTQREEVLSREEERYGGIKWGSAFFGWLAAAGMAVLLTAVLSAVGAGVGLSASGGDIRGTEQQLAKNASTVGVIGAVGLAVILFVAYYCGGYVAGRMARFSGPRQGFAVWIWAIVIAVIVAVVAAVAGSRFDILNSLNSFPRIPLDEGALTVTGIVTAVVAALLSLVGAILGGVAGMRYHRRIDRVGLGR